MPDLSWMAEPSECECPCDTNAEHVAKYSDLYPHGDDLPNLIAPLGEPGGDAMSVTWTVEARCPVSDCGWTTVASDEEEGQILVEIHKLLRTLKDGVGHGS